MLDWLRGLVMSVTAFAEGRSPRWPKVRAEHLLVEPYCQVCGRFNKLEVHHIVPFQVDHLKELDSTNLITLCDPGDGGCHIRWGHLFNWQSWNTDVRADASVWQKKVVNRPRKGAVV